MKKSAAQAARAQPVLNEQTIRIPAKTFIIGEYAALQGLPALIVTTPPAFEMHLTHTPELQGIHPQSPAGRFWQAMERPEGLRFEDPYEGMGGLGASSAQFLSAYQLYCALSGQSFSHEALLASYQIATMPSVGQKPSGYDVLAQSMPGPCVYIDRNHAVDDSFEWPFTELSLLLLHTQQKYATHEHLQQLSATLPALSMLGDLSTKAYNACQMKAADAFIDAIQTAQKTLFELGWVSAHSQQQQETLFSLPGVLAIKGCGAMGADLLCLVLETSRVPEYREYFSGQPHWIVSTEPYGSAES